ncbi:MAG: nitroreductase family protein [Proteobacteria bacterium]|nr:nitroreductase family protein [Pseudomonadota bacterium]MDA1058695.1 nitroreductase family protein [Pseudomonadota bacterium]
MLHKTAETAAPIHELLANRWSPRAFTDRPVEPAKLLAVFEAARWAASSSNGQPWAFIVAQRSDKAAFDQMLQCLVPGNQSWAALAPVLILTFARLKWAGEERVNRTAQHDLGMATAMLSIQAEALGLRTHHMSGIDLDKIREVYAVPPDFDPVSAIALGYQGDAALLPEEKDRAREPNPRTRKPLDEFVFAGRFGAAAGLL